MTFIILINSTELIIDRFYIETFNTVFYLEIFAIPFTILCIFFMLNALNMSDGINGSLITYTIPVFIIIFSLTSNFLYLMILLSLIVLLYFNLSNKLFLGNNGSSLISAIISLIIIYETKNNVYILSAEQILLIFSIPTFDLLRLFYTRIINKKNPFLGDLNHFHHIVLNRNQKFIWIPLIISYLIMIYFVSGYIYSILLLLITLIIYISLLTYFRKYK